MQTPYWPPPGPLSIMDLAPCSTQCWEAGLASCGDRPDAATVCLIGADGRAQPARNAIKSHAITYTIPAARDLISGTPQSICLMEAPAFRASAPQPPSGAVARALAPAATGRIPPGSRPPADTSARYPGCLALTSVRGFGRRCRLARLRIALASSLDFLQGTFEKICFQRLVRHQPL